MYISHDADTPIITYPNELKKNSLKYSKTKSDLLNGRLGINITFIQNLNIYKY